MGYPRKVNRKAGILMYFECWLSIDRVNVNFTDIVGKQIILCYEGTVVALKVTNALWKMNALLRYFKKREFFHKYGKKHTKMFEKYMYVTNSCKTSL